MGHRVLRRFLSVNPLEFFDGLILGSLGVAMMTGGLRGVDSALPGNVIASLLYIAAGGLLISGRASGLSRSAE